jgi:hypothetical protein
MHQVVASKIIENSGIRISDFFHASQCTQSRCHVIDVAFRVIVYNIPVQALHLLAMLFAVQWLLLPWMHSNVL